MGTLMDMALEIGLAVLAVALFPVLGWISLRYLRAAPDLPHKAEMIRSAKWGGLIFGLVGVLPYLAGRIMVWHMLPWAMTALGVGSILFWVVLLAESIVFWPGIGAGVALAIAGKRLRRETFDWQDHMQKAERSRRPTWRRVFQVLGILIIGFWGYMIPTRLLPADRLSQVFRWQDAVEAQMEAALGDLPVRQVHVFSEDMLDYLPSRTPSPGTLHNQVIVGLREGADDAMQAEAAEQVGDVLEAVGARGEWAIRIRVRDGPRLKRSWSPASDE